MADPSDARTKPDPRVNPWRDDLAAEHLRGEIDAPVYARGHDRVVVAPVTALRRAPAHGAMMDTQLLNFAKILSGHMRKIFTRKMNSLR